MARLIGKKNVAAFKLLVTKMRPPLALGYPEEFELVVEEGVTMYQSALKNPEVNLAYCLESFIHKTRTRIELGKEADEEPNSGEVLPGFVNFVLTKLQYRVPCRPRI